jgi:hypothetical protein
MKKLILLICPSLLLLIFTIIGFETVLKAENISLRQGQERVRVLSGGINLRYQTDPEDDFLNEIGDSGRVDIDGVDFEVDLEALVRATDSSLFEVHKIAGLRGLCQAYADGERVAEIKMQTGRMEMNIWGALIDTALNSIFEGQPDSADVEFSSSSDKAEWSTYMYLYNERYKLIVRFIYRDAADSLRYYVFAEKI